VKRSRGPLVISSVYFIFGFTWILVSDRLLWLLTSDLLLYQQLQTRKGWIYVAITTLLIYVLLRIFSRRKEQAYGELAEKQRLVEESLEAKRRLNRELHHRVKNNLQLMISIVNLSGEGSRDTIIGRIYAISTVQEAIYTEEDFSRISLSRYLQDIVGFLRERGLAKGTILLPDIDESASLPVESAVPFGILFHELVSNAMVHGSSGEAEGSVEIVLRRRGEKELVLTVTDKGGGFSPDEVQEKTGLSIAREMISQLKGSLSFTPSGGGTQAEVIITPLQASRAEIEIQ
jgi:two-component sensor histidine kinase